MNLKVFLIGTSLLYGLHVHAMDSSSTISHLDKKIKLDIISVYNTVFDVRKQLRMGLEYQVKSSKLISQTYHLDFGMYDSYRFDKYYDFFGTNGGIHKDETNVKTFGFQFLYGLQYNFKRPEIKKTKYFTSLILDINFFNKDIRKHNTKTDERESHSLRQFRTGIGPELGLEFKLTNRFSLEAKSALILKLLTIKSDADSPNIKPYKALWYDTYHSFWFIPRLNLCYALKT